MVDRIPTSQRIGELATVVMKYTERRSLPKKIESQLKH